MTIGERPCSRNLSIRLMATLAMYAATVLVTSTLAAAQEKVLHDFKNDGTDGTEPSSGLISNVAGNLYGVTFKGGLYGYRDSVRVDARTRRELDGDRCCTISVTVRTGLGLRPAWCSMPLAISTAQLPVAGLTFMGQRSS